jgi:transposase-like protein
MLRVRFLSELVLPLNPAELATESAACDAFAAVRWPTGVILCPTCSRPCERNLAQLRCTRRRPHHFTIFVGTPLGTKLKPNVRATLLAIRAMTTTARSISARELAREVGMNHVTLWRHMQSIRASLLPDGTADPRPRIVEQTIATWLNGTFHGISREWRHRYRQELGARWYMDAFMLVGVTCDSFQRGGEPITLRMARSRTVNPWHEAPPSPAPSRRSDRSLGPASPEVAAPLPAPTSS